MINTWEKCVIGTVLTDPGTLEAAQDLLPSDFTGVAVPVWAEILSLASRDGLGLRALTEALRHSQDVHRFDEEGGLDAFLAECVSYRGSEIAEYVRQVLDTSTKRALVNASALIAVEARREGASGEELIDYAEGKIMALRRNRGVDGVTMEDLMSVFLPRIDAIRDGTYQPAFTPHLPALKNQLDFLEPSDYWIIAGRPGEGKSSIMRFEMAAQARAGKPATIINLENDRLEYARCLLALEANIDSRLLKDARKLSEEQMERLHQAANHVRRLPIRIVDMPGASVGEITRRMRRAISEDKTTIIGIDYVQLIGNGLDNANADISLTSRSLRTFALSNGVPVIANAQLSRDIERRGANDASPKLSDLRDSGSLEQDATIVTFVRGEWRAPTGEDIAQFPENVDPRSRRVLLNPVAVPVRFHTLKNRNGTTGVSELVKWNKATGNYQTLAQEAH